jgi:hypothetical protein
MKHLAFLAVMMFAVPAIAQDKPAAEQAKPAAQEPAKEAAKPSAEPKKQAAAGPRMPHPRRWNEDARHCLERPSNTEIIKCAEEYL